MKLFTFQFKTGNAEIPFHHRFEVMANSQPEAVEFLLKTDAFQRLEQMFELSEHDKKLIEEGLQSPRVKDGPALLDWRIFTDEETEALG